MLRRSVETARQRGPLSANDEDITDNVERGCVQIVDCYVVDDEAGAIIGTPAIGRQVENRTQVDNGIAASEERICNDIIVVNSDAIKGRNQPKLDLVAVREVADNVSVRLAGKDKNVRTIATQKNIAPLTALQGVIAIPAR